MSLDEPTILDFDNNPPSDEEFDRLEREMGIIMDKLKAAGAFPTVKLGPDFADRIMQDPRIQELIKKD